MRKVIVQEFITLNGLASGPGGNVDFIPASATGDQGFGRRQLGFMDSIDTILLGRNTYKMFSEYWPDATSGEDKEFAQKINATPKVVFSKTLDRAPWGTFEDARIVKSDAAAEVAKLKKESGKDMVMWGSISLAQSLLADGLVDEIQLLVCPVILTDGAPMFTPDAESRMKLLKSQSFDRGVVLLAYQQR